MESIIYINDGQGNFFRVSFKNEFNHLYYNYGEIQQAFEEYLEWNVDKILEADMKDKINVDGAKLSFTISCID